MANSVPIREAPTSEPPPETPFHIEAPRTRGSRSRIQWPYWIAVAIIIAISLWTGDGRRYLNSENPRVDIQRLQQTDVDYHMLYPSIEAKHDFTQTFAWWREPWRSDTWVGAYWRPLTMQAWWIESHTFGEDRPANWMRTSLLLSILFDLLLVSFVRTFTSNKWLALAALAIFALPPWWPHAISPLTVLPRVSNADLLIAQGWKDQPDLWANCLIVAAMICSLREKWIPTLVFTALAIAFKESGLVVFPLVAILMICQRRMKSIPLWVYGASVSMLVLMMYARSVAGPLVFHFHSYGGNAGGPTRYTNAMFPLGFAAFSSAGQALCAFGVFALLVLRPKRPLVWLASLVALFVATVGCIAIQQGLTLDIAFAQLVLIGSPPIALLVLWLLLGTTIWKEKSIFHKAATFAACGYVAAIPFAMATQAALHCLALANAFLAAYGACATFALVLYLIEPFMKRFPKMALLRDQLRVPVISKETNLAPVTLALPIVPSPQA
jgi:hypothetical protein